MCNGSSHVHGDPHIVDHAGRRELPVGIESFADMLSGFVYVDKTLALKELVDRCGVTQYCRPRRFGKSTLLRMIQCFFELPVQGYIPDCRELFDDLAIAGQGERYLEERGAHPVVYLNLASCAGATFADARARISQIMADEYIRHAYLLESPRLLGFEKERFERVAAGAATPAELTSSLATLSKLLSRHHGGAQAVILIDEYDTPINEGYVKGYRQEMLDFYRSWLTDALKGTTNLYCAALTGVLRVSQESIFSELNNVQVDTTLDDDHAEAIGFTEAEAEALATYVGRADRMDDMRQWYDGYRFGTTRVYNPWSVLRFLRSGEAQPYWTNTSSNGIVRDLVARAGQDETVELARLAAGGTVARPLDLRTVFDGLASNPSAVWAQMYQAGYLTTEDTGFPNDSKRQRALKVPNFEVGELFAQELIDRSVRMAGSRHRLDALHRAVSSADAPAFQDALRQILLDSPSYHDLTDEGRYHTLLLGLLYCVPGYKPATSNRESGDGRCDVLLEPLPERARDFPALAMELKLAKKGEDLVEVARDVALAQAVRLSYGHGLAGSRSVLWGIAFYGKDVACAC